MDGCAEDLEDERKVAADLKTSVASLDALNGEKVRGTFVSPLVPMNSLEPGS